MDERQRFEDWFASLGMWRAHVCAKNKDSQGRYEDPKAQHDWKVWQAALSYKHPEPDTVRYDYTAEEIEAGTVNGVFTHDPSKKLPTQKSDIS